MSPSSPVRPRASEALNQSPIPALRRLRVTESDVRVVISGDVSSYYLKQLAQETVMGLLDRRELLNQITVTRPPVAAQRRA